jgi:hypothetical protein
MRVMTKLLLLISIFCVGVILNLPKSKVVDARTKQICMEEAKVDHKRYILEERWERWGDDWKDYDWYKSCIENVTNTRP